MLYTTWQNSFTAVEILEPSEDMIGKIAETLISKTTDLRDFSSFYVVFPNIRPAHYLRKELFDRIEKSFIPPRIFSMDQFIDFVFEKKYLEFKPIDAVDGVSLLYDMLTRNNLSKNFPNEYFLKSFDRFYPLGIKIFNILEELCIEDVTKDKIREIDAFVDLPIGKSKDFVFCLSEIYERFYEMLKELKLSTRSFKYRTVASEDIFLILSDEEKLSLYFGGFFAFTKSEQMLFKKIFKLSENKGIPLNLFFYNTDGFDISNILNLFSININRQGKTNENSSLPDIKIYACPDIHGQAHALGTIIKETDFNEKTAIVLPAEDALFPIIRHAIHGSKGAKPLSDEQSSSEIKEEKINNKIFWGLKEAEPLSVKNYNISMGYPLLRTPIWSFFQSLFELVNAFCISEAIPLSEYLKFMLHPYIKNIFFEGDSTITRIMIHSIEQFFEDESASFNLEDLEDTVIQKIIDRTDELKPIGYNALRKHLKEIHNNTIRTLTEIQNIKEFAQKCKNILNYIYEKSTAKMHPLFFPFYADFIAEFDNLSNSLVAHRHFDELSTYFIFLKRYLQNKKHPFEGTPLKGLQILGFLETRNIRFEKVFFMNLNEEIFPPLWEDYLLPKRAREFLGLPTSSDREKLLEYYFNLLIKGAKEVHLFYIKNFQTERSRFLEKIIWQKEKQKIQPAIAFIKYNLNLANKKPEEIKKTSEVIDFIKGFTFSASCLDCYLKCPLKFYYSYVLNLQEKKDYEDDVENMEIGDIVHQILKKYFSPLQGKLLEEKDFDTVKIEKIIAEYFKTTYGERISGSLFLIMKQIKKRLKEFIEKEKNKVSNENIILVGVEKEIREVKFSEFRVKAKIDRIEQRNGKIFIIDYKISSNEKKFKIDFDKLDGNNRENWHETIGSLQIPFYMLLYSKAYREDLKNIDGCYILLGDNDKEVNIFQDRKIENIMKIEEIINKLLKEIVNPEVGFFPPFDFKKACPFCSYKTLCGTLWIKDF